MLWEWEEENSGKMKNRLFYEDWHTEEIEIFQNTFPDAIRLKHQLICKVYAIYNVKPMQCSGYEWSLKTEFHHIMLGLSLNNPLNLFLCSSNEYNKMLPNGAIVCLTEAVHTKWFSWYLVYYETLINVNYHFIICSFKLLTYKIITRLQQFSTHEFKRNVEFLKFSHFWPHAMFILNI